MFGNGGAYTYFYFFLNVRYVSELSKKLFFELQFIHYNLFSGQTCQLCLKGQTDCIHFLVIFVHICSLHFQEEIFV